MKLIKWIQAEAIKHGTYKTVFILFYFCDSFYNIALVKLVDTRTENIRADVYETTTTMQYFDNSFFTNSFQTSPRLFRFSTRFKMADDRDLS